MTEAEYRELFAGMDKEQVIEQAVRLALDCDRLRLELDGANSVIR